MSAEEDAAVTAIANEFLVDTNLIQGIRDNLGGATTAAWLDTGTLNDSAHAFRVLVRGFINHFNITPGGFSSTVADQYNQLTGVVPDPLDVFPIEDQSDTWNKKKATIQALLDLVAKQNPDHAQSELTSPVNFSQSDTTWRSLAHATDHEISGITRTDSSTWTVGKAGLYEIAYAYDLEAPSVTNSTAEARVTANATPISQSIVHEGMSTTGGLDQIVHPGFLVTLTSADALQVEMHAVAAGVATWQVSRGHFRVRLVSES